MSPATITEKVSRFQNTVSSTTRIGVSEFARSREWREQLPQIGCLEVVDRNGVVGYLLSPDFAQALSAHITELEEQDERAAIAAMIEARKNRTEFATGEALKNDALAYLDEHLTEMQGAVDGR